MLGGEILRPDSKETSPRYPASAWSGGFHCGVGTGTIQALTAVKRLSKSAHICGKSVRTRIGRSSQPVIFRTILSEIFGDKLPCHFSSVGEMVRKTAPFIDEN
jgi:hypothetical protein